MLAKSLAYAKHFLRVAFYFKLNFIMLIGVPVVSILFNQQQWFVRTPRINDVAAVLSSWLGYMLAYWYLVSGSGTTVIISREEHFLKMFYFISRGVVPIIIGDFLANSLTLFAVIILLDLVLMIAFKMAFAGLCMLLLLSAIVSSIPVYCAFLLIGLFPLKTKSLPPVTTIITAFLIFLTAYSFHDDQTFLVYLFTLINPAEYTRQLGLLFAQLAGAGVTGAPHVAPLFLAAVTAVYLTGGALAVKKVALQPNYKL
ncbi:MAG: hypothetical protein ABF868_05120 [Sporolactobacillus sp.]